MARSSLSKLPLTRRSATVPTTIANSSRTKNSAAAETIASLNLTGRRAARSGSRTFTLPQHVAGAAHGVQQARLAPRLELAAQVGDEDVDRVGLGERVVAPDVVEEGLARDDEPGVAHQVLEQLELAGGEVDLPVAATDLAGVSGLRLRSPVTSEALPRGGRRRRSARILASSSSRSNGLTR